MGDERQRSLFAAFAELLSYPRGQVATAAEAAQALVDASSRAGAALRRFAASASAHDAAWLEELYTTTFDLDPACAPYIGHQLFGDTPVRGPFLAKLAEVVATCGFRPREELADHVAEVLRFLAVSPSGAARDDLLRDGLVPALGRMVAALDDRENPYRDVLVAMLELLHAEGAEAPPAAEEVTT